MSCHCGPVWKKSISLSSRSHFSEIRSRNQSVQTVSLHHPPSVLTLVSDNHYVTTRHWQLILPLKKKKGTGNKLSGHDLRGASQATGPLLRLGYLSLEIVDGFILLAALRLPRLHANRGVESVGRFFCAQGCSRDQQQAPSRCKETSKVTDLQL